MNNRAIKFRFWLKEQEKMLDDIRARTDDYTDMLNETIDYLQNDGVVFMQYTRLKDQEGKEIYEGDILKWRDLLGFVQWNRVAGRYRLQRNKKVTPIDYLDLELAKKCKIIGNKFENSELIESDEQ